MKILKHRIKRLITEVITEQTLSNPRLAALNALGALSMGATKPFKDGKPDQQFIDANNKLKELAPTVQEISEYTGKLGGAFLFAVKGSPDEKIQKKFGITGSEAKAKIKSMMNALSKESK